MYKIITDILIQKGNLYIPKDTNNSDYKQFLKDVKEQGVGIVEGPDIVTPDYKGER